MVTIFQIEKNPLLRKHAEPVLIKDIQTSHIQQILSDMKEAMDSQDDAVAIAAPQIGVPLRIFIVSGRVFMEPPEYTDTKTKKMSVGEKKVEEPADDIVCINPQITKLSRKKELMEEGCLSVRWLYGKVRRSTKATLTAHDEHGKKFTRGASGLLAQVFQHENDHLNGILFIDTAEDLRELPPSSEKKTDEK